uniref:ML domain-containing protein n=1 Tax=Globodera pallida TaxID=36090 RepID=A0A183CFD7_GLOPA
MNKFVGALLFLVLVVVDLPIVYSATQPPKATTTQKPTKVKPSWALSVSVKLVNKTEECRHYELEINNQIFMWVCDAKIRVQLPSSATLENVTELKPINGTADLFSLPRSIYPGKYLVSELTVTGEGEPKVEVLDVSVALSTKKCPAKVF